MKQFVLTLGVSLMATVAFCQSQHETLKAAARDPKSIGMAAIADTTLVEKKELTATDKKKRQRRERAHKECSRMKS